MATQQVDVKAVITAEDRGSAVVGDFANNTRKATTAIAAGMAAAGAGLILYTKSAVDYTVQLTKSTKELSHEAGLTAENASALLYVTQRMGITAQQTTQFFGLFSKRIAETASAADYSKTALGALGVQVKDAQGYTRGFNDILLDTADVFASMPDGAQKTAQALEIFGRSGKDLLPVLNLGSQGIKDLEAQAEKLGLTLTTANVASVTKYIQATKNLTDAQNSLKIQIGQLTAPVLASLETRLTSVLQKIINATGPFKNLAAGAVALGGPLLSLGGSALAVGANIAQVAPALRVVGSGLLRAAPIVGAVTAAVGAGSFAWKVFRDRTEETGAAFDKAQDAAQNVTTTLKNQVTTLRDVESATKSLNNAQLDSYGASLSVERAQISYNEAVRDHGAASLEAREANYQLAKAIGQLQESQKGAADAQDQLNKKEQEFNIQTPGAVMAIDIRAQHIDGIALNANNAAGQIAVLDLSIRNADSNVGKLIQTSQKAGTIKFNPVTGVPLRAKGGAVTGGMPYWVGEEGVPELFVPNQSGEIIPMNKVSSGGGGSGGNTTINVNLNAQAFLGSQVEARKFAQDVLRNMQDIAASKNMTLSQMVGA